MHFHVNKKRGSTPLNINPLLLSALHTVWKSSTGQRHWFCARGRFCGSDCSSSSLGYAAESSRHPFHFLLKYKSKSSGRTEEMGASDTTNLEAGCGPFLAFLADLLCEGFCSHLSTAELLRPSSGFSGVEVRWRGSHNRMSSWSLTNGQQLGLVGITLLVASVWQDSVVFWESLLLGQSVVHASGFPVMLL